MATGRISDYSIGNGKAPEMKALATPIQCNHCHTEIAATVALTFEGEDYIYHFCGPPCLAAWRKAANAP